MTDKFFWGITGKADCRADVFHNSPWRYDNNGFIKLFDNLTEFLLFPDYYFRGLDGF